MTLDSTVTASLPRAASLSSQQSATRLLKLVCCVCFLLIAVALLLIERYSPATGYELSIYSSLPAAVWVCLIAALAGGTVIVVHQAFAGNQTRYWVAGFLALTFALCVILLLPAFRGYYLYGALDTKTHTDFAEDLLSRGHFEPDNQYPITHILLAQLVHASGASPQMVSEYIPVFFTVLFMLFSYLLASSVMPKTGSALLAAATTPLFFNYYHVCTYPQSLSVMALPLLFYLYFKGSGSASMAFRIAFVTLLLLFPYFHPAPAGVLVVSLLGAEIAKALWRRREQTSSTTMENVADRISLEPTLIASVAFLTWISSHGIFYKTIWNTLAWLRGEIEGIPRVAEVETLLQTTGLGIGDQFVLALKMYGDNLVYLSLSMAALVIVAKRFLERRAEVRNLSTLSMPFLISGPAWVLIFASTLSVTLGRLLGSNIMMWATPVFAAFALYELFGRWKKAGPVAVTAILLCSSVFGIFGVYHSPFILQTNWQITRQDVEGSRWFVARARPPFDRGFASLGVASTIPGRFPVPEHFGYREHRTLGESFPMDTYVVLTEA
ncbi:MAG TPA: hypothetical protein VJ714_00200, partial [Anaerolineae bacterium]|nr:hypothetical protein [Anaerolineae bacterium]